MNNRYVRSLISSSLSIVPMVFLVYVLCWSKVAPLSAMDQGALALACIILIVGLALFQIGSTNSLTKVGEYMGGSLSKQKKLFIVILFAFVLGALITCAEPSIMIVSTQININRYLLVGSIAVGVGIFVAIGVLRIFFRKSLKVWYLFFYFITFLLICLLSINPNNNAYLPFIFDAGGITTGSATVPFILSLGAGVAAVRGGKNSTEDSFGLVGIASIGPIITMTILILVNPSGFNDYVVSTSDLNPFQRFLLAFIYTGPTSMGTFIDCLMALAPIIIIFMIYELIYIRLPMKKIGSLFVGFLVSYIGLVLFLAPVGSIMSPIGLSIGQSLGLKSAAVVFIIAFIIGMVTILCEPAVHVLTAQINNVSDGTISKFTVLITLSIGVGVAILLSAIRTYYNFSIMYYIVPGYLISVCLMFICPNIFTSIAFDSGGTASGPMSVSFVLPMVVGICSARNGVTHEQWMAMSEAAKQKYSGDINGFHFLQVGLEFYDQAFGVVAMIALTPIIAIQILGITVEFKKAMRMRKIAFNVHDALNEEIINF